MKKIKFFAMAAAAALLTLGACSEDKIDVPENGTAQNKPTWGSSDDAVFMEVNIDLPNAKSSRSQTTNPEKPNDPSQSDSGVEIGQEYENTVNEVIVVLATPNVYNYIASAKVSTGDLQSITTNNSKYKALSKFSKTEISFLYGEDGNLAEGASEIVSVFVFCNPNEAVYKAIANAVQGENGWIIAKGEVTSSSPIWTNNDFLMTNATIAKRFIPKSLEEWNYFTTKENPFDLSGVCSFIDTATDQSKQYFNDDEHSIGGTPGGAIRVERAAVRFDLRDGSLDGLTEAGKKAGLNGIGDFKYQVVKYQKDIDSPEEPVLDIQLQKLCLVNMNNDYYLLRHVSSNGNPEAADVTICMPEKAWTINSNGGYVAGTGNYVVDADYTWKIETYTRWNPENSTFPSTWDFAEHLIYPFFNADGSIDNTNLINDKWGTDVMSQVINRGQANNTEGWEADNKDYKIWRYATENTIAGVDRQINAYSTGIVFKGILSVSDDYDPEKVDNPDLQEIAEIIANKDKKLNADDPYANPIIYKFAGNLYSTWPRLRQAALDAAMPTFTWIPTHEDEEGNKVEGHYELETINRSNSIYAAVFGINGGFGKQEFELTEMDPNTNKPVAGENDPETGKPMGRLKKYEFTDTQPKVTSAANWAWDAWDEAGKPGGNAPTKIAYKKAVTAAEITIYQTSVDPSYGVGYYCYYYYWNRHHDNHNNGVMGPMEFATVRNNVYKLAVTKISELGHPRISENDPYNPTPGTPDESQDVYLTVQTEVLPWVVRVNDIQF